jgi:multiple sugar transport system substrate-binding protein
MKKLYLVSAILMVLMFVVSACQPAVAPTAETIIQTVVVTREVEGEVVTVVETVEVPVEVEVEVQPGADLTGSIRVTMWESGDALEPYNNALASFQEKYPNVEVSLEPVPQDYGTKLLADIAAGTPPDVFQLGDGDVSKYVAQGAVQPLDDLIANDADFTMDAFFPGIANFGQVGDSVYLFTKDYSPLVLYFNKDHFNEAGIALPTAEWTQADLLDAAQKLTLDGNGNNAQSPDFDSGNIVRWGIQIPAHWGDLLWLRGTLPIIYSNGGSVISEDGTTVEGYLNSPETIAALQWYTDLILTHHVTPTVEDTASFGGDQMFPTGIVSMTWTGRWPMKDWQRISTLNFGTAGIPAGSAGNANALCWAGFAISSQTQNIDAAWAWLKHVAAEEGAQEFAIYALTAVQDIARLQGLDTDPYNAPIIADLANTKPLPEFANPLWGACGAENTYRANMELVFLGDMTVQEAMDTAAAEIQACFDAGGP